MQPCNPDITIPEDATTLAEVEKAVRQLQNGKAAGSDEITPELLKYAETPISQTVHQLFGVVWSTGKVPADWKGNGKGRPTSRRPVCSKCRPISLLMCCWPVCSLCVAGIKGYSNQVSRQVDQP